LASGLPPEIDWVASLMVKFGRRSSKSGREAEVVRLKRAFTWSVTFQFRWALG
jgi:hypothetical protein